MKRTKSRKQCRTEALLMGEGWTYHNMLHAFIHWDHSTVTITQLLDAETFQDLSFQEYRQRETGYVRQDEN